MLNKFKFAIIILLTLSIAGQAVFAKDNFNYMYFFLDKESQEGNKISFEVVNDGELKNDDMFTLDLKINNVIEYEICKKILNLDGNTGFLKITCIVPKDYDLGEYVFTAHIIRDNNIVKTEKAYVNLNENFKSDILFKELEGNKTLIELRFENTTQIRGNYILEHEIPKSVIALLNDDNKDFLITSPLEYQILKEDPLIAWSIDKAPSKINYTMNKRISEDQKAEFSVDIKKDNYFSKMSYVVLFLIIIIVVAAFYPLLKKKKN